MRTVKDGCIVYDEDVASDEASFAELLAINLGADYVFHTRCEDVNYVKISMHHANLANLIMDAKAMLDLMAEQMTIKHRRPPSYNETFGMGYACLIFLQIIPR